MSHPFDPQKGLIVIPTRVCGPMGDTVVRLGLDTGATQSMLTWDVVVLLGYDPAIVSDRVQMTTGSGVEFVPRLIVDRIEALRKEHRTFPVLCHTLPPSSTVDGVLGLDFFRGQRLIIDFRAGQVVVE